MMMLLLLQHQHALRVVIGSHVDRGSRWVTKLRSHLQLCERGRETHDGFVLLSDEERWGTVLAATGIAQCGSG